MAAQDLPRVRLTPVPETGVLVVRGDELDAELIAEDASRFHERFAAWGRFGVSAFHAADDAEVDALCESRLVRFDRVLVIRRAHLERAGLEVVPTFRTPHVTVCHANLQSLITLLISCEHIEIRNPYHVGEPEGD